MPLASERRTQGTPKRKDADMLVLTRKLHQRVLLDGGRIVVEVVRLESGQVGLGFIADKEISIMREELLPPRTPDGDGRGGSAV
jgi:carbon storage regulator CsrA